MSTYRRYAAADENFGLTDSPEFLNRYLRHLCDFAGQQPQTVAETGIVLREFLQYILHIRHNGPSSVSGKNDFRDICIGSLDLGFITSIGKAEVASYIEYLENVARNSAKTKKRKLLTVRNMYQYLETYGQELGVRLPAGDPTAGFRFVTQAKQSAARVLTPRQISKLLDATSGENALRDKSIILLISTTAMSLSEVVALNRDDVDLNARTIRIHSEGQDRTAYLTVSCAEHLRRYIQTTDLFSSYSASNPLFVANESTRRLTQRSVQLRISEAAANAGMADLNISARDLRDTAITLLLRGKTIQEQTELFYSLGYRTTRTMARFISIAQPEVSDLMKNALEESPLSSIGCEEDEE